MDDKRTIQTLIRILDTQLEYFVNRSIEEAEKEALSHDEYLFLNCID